MKGKWISIVMISIVLAAIAGVMTLRLRSSMADPPNPAQVNIPASEGKVLATARFTVGGQPKLLALTMQEARPVSQKRHSIESRLVLFRLKRYAIKQNQVVQPVEATVWQDFDRYMSGVYPLPSYSGDVKADATDSKLYLCLAFSREYRLVLTLFKIDPAQKSNAVLPRFNQRGDLMMQSSPPKPLSQFQKQFNWNRSNECGAKDVLIEEVALDHLLIRANRWDAHCPPVYFRFDLKTKKWSEAKAPEKEKGIAAQAPAGSATTPTIGSSHNHQ